MYLFHKAVFLEFKMEGAAGDAKPPGRLAFVAPGVFKGADDGILCYFVEGGGPFFAPG